MKEQEKLDVNYLKDETTVAIDDRVSFIKVPGKQAIKIPADSIKVVHGTTSQAKERP